MFYVDTSMIILGNILFFGIDQNFLIFLFAQQKVAALIEAKSYFLNLAHIGPIFPGK